MTLKKPFLFCVLLLCQWVCAQQDTIVRLREVLVSDGQLKSFSKSLSVVALNDSIIEKNAPSLTSLLQFNSVVYFKENGLGMVSSPSFRGTTAQQTAVIWNGININSQLNGQTDFNTITTRDFDNISLRAGGGSAVYGSGAIGGSIHLNNTMLFKNQFKNEVQLGYGNFNTFDGHYKITASSEKISTQVSISRNSSENNYRYLNTENRHNENGQFYNTSVNANFGYQINKSNFIKLYSQVFESERHFSLFSSSETKTKYADLNTRNLLAWNLIHRQFSSELKFAFLTEQYNYFGNIYSKNSTFGKVETAILKYDLTYNLNKKITLNSILESSQNKGRGTEINLVKRQTFSGTLLLEHLVSSHFNYELSLRKELTNNYKSPILFSIGTNFHPFPWYTLKLNLSKNFRIPSFNDLYWEDLGNPNLKPENSYQAELGNTFVFSNLRFSATVYHIRIRDMIRWIPGNSGIFSPENTDRVAIYGFEGLINYSKKFGMQGVSIAGSYGYSDSKNETTQKQLIYVPYHKLTAAVSYQYDRLSLHYQYLFTGAVFTQSDNNPYKIIQWYNVSNGIVGYDLGKSKNYQLGFKVLNLWNVQYESVENRPLPGRNFNLYLIFKF